MHITQRPKLLKTARHMPNKPPKIMNNWAKIRYRFSPQHLIPQLATYWYMRDFRKHKLTILFINKKPHQTTKNGLTTTHIPAFRFSVFCSTTHFSHLSFSTKPTWPPFSAFFPWWKATPYHHPPRSFGQATGIPRIAFRQDLRFDAWGRWAWVW